MCRKVFCNGEYKKGERLEATRTLLQYELGLYRLCQKVLNTGFWMTTVLIDEHITTSWLIVSLVTPDNCTQARSG